MDAIDPRPPLNLLPPGSKAVVAAEKQTDKYTPLPSVYTPDGKVLTRWRPTQDELAALVRGEDLYLTQLTFGAALQPVMLTVGPPDLSNRDEYGRVLS